MAADLAANARAIAAELAEDRSAGRRWWSRPTAGGWRSG